MGGQGAVAGVPGKRRVRQMSDGAIQDRILVAFDDDARQAHARDFHVPIGSPLASEAGPVPPAFVAGTLRMRSRAASY